VTLSLEQIAHLLNSLKSLPPLRKQELTFMEIAGYTHYENICSNILQFYLQPSNEHGFGSLLLDSLFALINEERGSNGQNIDVRREELTPERKRIDLIIESDDFIFGIENKIFAPLSKNQLKDYANHLKSTNGRKVYKVLLSLRPLKVSPEDLHGFKPITYRLLFEKVIANIGSYFLTGREPHTIFFRDFIQTIQNLQEANSMDQQRLAFFHDNKQDLAILLKEVDVLRRDMRRKLTNLKQIIDQDLSQLPYSNDTDRGFWRNSSLRDFLWCSFKISNLLWLHVEVEITPSGWWMRFGNRSGGISKVEELLKSREIKYEINHNRQRLVYKGENHILPYNSSPEDSAKWVLDMLKRLTAS